MNLDDLGINQSQSKRWQREATVAESEFERYVERANKFGEEVTAAGQLRLSHKATCAKAQKKARGPQGTHGHTVLPAESVRLHETMPHCNCYSGIAFERADQSEIVQEITDHHALLCSLLAPVCDATDSLLPIQRQAIRRYLAETGQLLKLLAENRTGLSRGRIAQ